VPAQPPSQGGVAAPGYGPTAQERQARLVRATRTRFSTHGPKAQRGTVIRFRLRKPGKVELVLRADGSACRVIGRKRVRGHSGLNRVRFNGRVNGRPLAAGKYTITVVVVRGGHRTRVGTLAVEVVPSGRHLTLAQQTAPVNMSCLFVGTPFSGSTSILAAFAVPFVDGSIGAGDSQAQTKSKLPPAALGASFKPPKLPQAVSPGGDGLFGWAGALLYAALGLAGATLVIQVARFLRGSWNP
jgi:hypothetical protein